jgi:hypothetical protein
VGAESGQVIGKGRMPSRLDQPSNRNAMLCRDGFELV